MTSQHSQHPPACHSPKWHRACCDRTSTTSSQGPATGLSGTETNGISQAQPAAIGLPLAYEVRRLLLLSEKRIRCPVCNKPISTHSGETFAYLFQSCASLGARWFPTNQAHPSNFSSRIYTNKLPGLLLSQLFPNKIRTKMGRTLYCIVKFLLRC